MGTAREGLVEVLLERPCAGHAEPEALGEALNPQAVDEPVADCARRGVRGEGALFFLGGSVSLMERWLSSDGLGW